MKTPQNFEVYTPAGKFCVTSFPMDNCKYYSIACRDFEFEREVHLYLNSLVPEKTDYEMKVLLYSDNSDTGCFETQALQVQMIFEPFNSHFIDAAGDDKKVFNFHQFIDDLIQSGEIDDLLKSRNEKIMKKRSGY